MKRTVLLPLFLIFSFFQSQAQPPVPNGGFETWSPYVTGTTPAYTYEMPDFWRTTDTITVANSGGLTHSASKEVTLVHSGTASLKLQSWTYYILSFPFLTGIPGCATNGDVVVDAVGQEIIPVSGTADSVLHEQLNGYYAYTAGGSGDTGSIEVCMFKRNTITGNRDTVATGKTYFLNQASYTHFSVNISTYGSTVVTPDSILIWAQSSPRSPLGSGQTGSVLLIDSLYFSGLLGMTQPARILEAIHVYPVPAENELTVELEMKKSEATVFELMDINGRTVLTHEMKSAKEKIDIHHLRSGNYFYTLADDAGSVQAKGKVSIR